MWRFSFNKTASFDDFSHRNAVGDHVLNLYPDTSPLPGIRFLAKTDVECRGRPNMPLSASWVGAAITRFSEGFPFTTVMLYD